MEALIDAKFVIDPNAPTPLYYQIRENLRELIRNGDLAPNALIPSERELSENYGVNRLTVRQAITELVTEGLLLRKHGIGTFVVEKKLTPVMPDLAGFSERILRSGRRPGSHVLNFTMQPAPRSVAHALGVDENTEVARIVRLRTADDVPIMMETCYLPLALIPDLQPQDLENNSLYRVLASRYGILMVEADELIEPVILTNYEAQVLQTEPGRPGLLIEGTVFQSGHRPVEYTKSLVRGDMAKFYVRLHRTSENAYMG